tara:strand:- start:191 stop:478 length:288 start_codon:yes stop_codon:yes gene_type:complete
MSKKIILSIVITLGILIIIAFLTLIYGMYLKISTKDIKLSNSTFVFSANLEDNEKIKNIEVLDKNKILILIERNELLIGAIYDSDKNQIIRFIER